MNRIVFLFLVFILNKTEAQTSVLIIADSLYANGNYSKAITQYKLFQNQADVYDKIARSYVAIGNFDEALKNYKASIEVKPHDALLKYDYARLLLSVKKYKEASILFNDLIHVDYNNPNYHFQLGLVLEKLEDDSAINRFISAYNLDQTHQKAIYKIALYYLQNKKYKLVDKYTNTGLESYPNNVELINLKAQNFLWQEEFESSVIWFEKLLELGESNQFIYESLCFCYAKMFKYNKAIENGLNALKSEPKNVNNLYILGNLYYENNDFVNAEKYIKRSLELKDVPLDAEYAKLATVLNQQKKYEEAIVALNKALKENPGNAETEFFLLITKDNYYADLDVRIKIHEDFKKKFPTDHYSEYIDSRIKKLKEEKFIKEGKKMD
uniref:tetratricopeptide repeat protein n=1 Tax=Mariniflexile sp. TaxID=1979402 RepID=UPI004047F824